MSTVRGNSMLSADRIGKYFHIKWIDAVLQQTVTLDRSAFTITTYMIYYIFPPKIRQQAAYQLTSHKRTDACLGAPTLLRVKNRTF